MKLDMMQMLNEKTDRILFDYFIPSNVDGDSENGVPVLPPPDVEFTAPVHVRGEITNNAGYMALCASATIPYRTSCSRCLAPVEAIFSLTFHRTVAVRGMLEDEDSDEYVIVEDGILDIDEQLVEELMLAFPMQFFCQEDCRGLCPKCGQNLNEADCGCARQKEIDPRLAILQKLLDNSEEV